MTSSGPYPSAPAPNGLKKKAKLDETIVKLNGKKLRAGTVPWRFVGDQGDQGNQGKAKIEVFLIEGINTPGFWTFPAGSLDPGEEVSHCALRETYEECGASGPLGCFLGVFEDKSRTYLFSMRVSSVEDEKEEIWHDPHSSYEGNGARRRGWFSPESARSVLKKDGPAMLDAFLAVQVQAIKKCRLPPGPKLRIFILGCDDDCSEALQKHCSSREEVLEVLPSAAELVRSTATEAQKFAIVAAALWEADALICFGAADVSYVVAMASSNGCPSLLLVRTPEMPMLLQGDSRVTTHFIGTGCVDNFLEKVKSKEKVPDALHDTGVASRDGCCVSGVLLILDGQQGGKELEDFRRLVLSRPAAFKSHVQKKRGATRPSA